ncbi:MAG TPA: hypothetical protein ENN33_04860, partial [Ignavibacteria bacterium]|nr:hypothetical protein [Ignavibacteria bacterium]
MSGCYIHSAKNYGELWIDWELELEWGDWFPFADAGTHGCGYGIILGYSSTNCLIENNIFRMLRHAMLLGCGANCNVLNYNYSREQYWTEQIVGADLCLHGRYPYANLMEQNIICQISVDDSHGRNGPYNAFIRNWVQIPPIDRIKWWKPIWLHESPNTSVLGCNTYIFSDDPIQRTGSTTSLAVDKFSYFNGAYRTHAYMHAYEMYYRLYYSALGDVSYFYSARPDFVSVDYTFPSLGPNYTSSCSQTIPAYNRYSQNNKTYLPNPILYQITTSGTLSQNETWSNPVGSNAILIVGNVIVPNGITLTILPGTTIKFSGKYSITVNDGAKIIAEGISSQPIRFTSVTGTSPGSWYDIRLNGGNSVFKHCIFEYGRYPIRLENATSGATT